MSEWKKRWAVGRWAPDFVLPSAAGVPTRLYGRAGGVPTVLLFCGRGMPAAQRQQLGPFCASLRAQGPASWALFLSHQGTPSDALEGQDALPDLLDLIFVDDQGELFDEPAGSAPQVVLLSPGLRIIEVFPLEDADEAAARVQAALGALPAVAPRQIDCQAPILLLPELLEAAACQHLLDVWRHGGHEETGVERSEAGQRREQSDASFKRRRDHVVQEPGLLKMLAGSLGRGLFPQIQKVFAYSCTRFEGFKIACYDASDQGFFRPHRDNLSPSTKHRRFALSLHLNGGYEGGQLRFPEYAPHLYSLEAGGGVVFSSSLLHEVTPVTAGQRFVLLTFAY